MLEIWKDMFPYFSKKTTTEQKRAFWIPYFLMVGLLGLIPAFDWLDEEIYDKTGMSPKDGLQKGVIKMRFMAAELYSTLTLQSEQD